MAVLTRDGSQLPHDGRERRSSRRRPLAEIPEITGVTVQSEKVDVIDAAAGGLLIQSPLRLSPGTHTRIAIGRVSHDPLNVGGCVVRSEVAMIAGGGIQYRSAIALDRRLDFIDEHDRRQARGAEPPAGDFAAFFVSAAIDDTEGEQGLASFW